MTAASPHEVTQLLAAWTDGDEAALEQLVPIIQAELRRLAKHYLKRERPGTRCKPPLWLTKLTSA